MVAKKAKIYLRFGFSTQCTQCKETKKEEQNYFLGTKRIFYGRLNNSVTAETTRLTRIERELPIGMSSNQYNIETEIVQ